MRLQIFSTFLVSLGSNVKLKKKYQQTYNLLKLQKVSDNFLMNFAVVYFSKRVWLFLIGNNQTFIFLLKYIFW